MEHTHEDHITPPIAPLPNHPQMAVAQKDSNDIIEIVRMLLIALAIVIPIRAFIAQPFKVSGASMVPTFHDREYLIVDEISYRFNEPKRGDVIVFHPPQDPGTYYIKRIIGLPGETVKIDGPNVLIINKENPNGILLTEPYISAHTNNNITSVQGTDEYFVMGDNRPYSSDSRTWGKLPKKNIVGRTFLRLYPFNEMSAFPGVYHAYEAVN